MQEYSRGIRLSAYVRTNPCINAYCLIIEYQYIFMIEYQYMLMQALQVMRL